MPACSRHGWLMPAGMRARRSLPARRSQGGRAQRRARKRAASPAARTEGGPAGRARGCGLFRPLPWSLRGWTGEGGATRYPRSPRRSRADDGQRKPGARAGELTGRSAGRWRPGPWATSAEAASCGVRMPPYLRQGRLLPGRTRARRSLRARRQPRREGGASRDDGPLFAGHGQGPASPRVPAGRGAGYLAAPLPCQDLEAATVDRYSRATPWPARCGGGSRQGWGYCPLPCPAWALKPQPGGACSGPGWAGLSQGREGPATGRGPAVVKGSLTTRRRQ